MVYEFISSYETKFRMCFLYDVKTKILQYLKILSLLNSLKFKFILDSAPFMVKRILWYRGVKTSTNLSLNL